MPGNYCRRQDAWIAYVAGTVLALNVLSDALFWFLAANLAGVVLILLQGGQFWRRWLIAQLLIIATGLPAYVGLELDGNHGIMGAFEAEPRLDWARVWWAFSGTYLFYVISLIKVRVFAPAIPGIGAVVAVLAACGLLTVRKQHGVLAVLLISVLCLPVGLLAVSLIKPIFMPRYLLWGAAPFGNNIGGVRRRVCQLFRLPVRFYVDKHAQPALVFCIGLYCGAGPLHRHVIGLTIWLGVFYAVLSARRQGSNPIPAFLVSKRIAYLGRISYSLYMVHMLVLVGWIWAVRRVGVPVEVQYFLLPAGCLGQAIAAAAAMHHLVEAPLHEFGKSFSKRGAAAVRAD